LIIVEKHTSHLSIDTVPCGSLVFFRYRRCLFLFRHIQSPIVRFVLQSNLLIYIFKLSLNAFTMAYYVPPLPTISGEKHYGFQSFVRPSVVTYFVWSDMSPYLVEGFQFQ